MEKAKGEQKVLRRTTKMPAVVAAAAAGSATSALATAGAASKDAGVFGVGPSSSASSSVNVESSPSRPSSPDVTTPALPKYRYSRDELINLRNSPLSKLKPEFLSSLQELLDVYRELDSTVASEPLSVRPGMTVRRQLNAGSGRTGGESRQFAGDDVGKNEAQHISLVPQRMSFGAGCHVTSSRINGSPDTKRERNRRDGHRIGSGRIQISEKHIGRELLDHSLSDREQDRDDRWYEQGEQRGIGGSNKLFKRESDRRRAEPYREDRYFGGSRNGRAEPEWFAAGPSSQSETIELHGFEQLEKSKNYLKEKVTSSSAHGGENELADEQRKAAPSMVTGDTVARESRKTTEDFDFAVETQNLAGVKDERDKCVKPSEILNSNDESSLASNQPLPETGKDGGFKVQSALPASPPSASLPPSWQPSGLVPLPHETNELDFNAFFNVDSIPGLNEMFGLESEQGKSGGSRFKQWFHFSSHGNSHSESRRSSLTDEFGYINDIIYGHSSSPGLGSTSPPVMPSLSSSSIHVHEKCSSEAQNLLELLQKAHSESNARLGTVPRKNLTNGTSIPHSSVIAPTGSGYGGAPNLDSVGCPPINCCPQNPDGSMDVKAVEAGLKAMLNSSRLSNSVLAGLPSAAQLGSMATGPPSGARVLLAEELEAHLVSDCPEQVDRNQLNASAKQKWDNGGKTAADAAAAAAAWNSLPPSSTWNGSNSGSLSFCSLPVLPIGTKVTLLSELESSLRSLDVGGQSAAAGLQKMSGARTGTGSNLSSSAAGRPVLSHDGSAFGQSMMSTDSFSSGMRDFAACKKLLGLVMDTTCGQPPIGDSLPIVTSPTSISMSNLEANQPNNSLANNQRDFIQRYLLQQQQLKMLNHGQPMPPPPQLEVIAAPLPSGIPPHLLPPDIPHSAYQTPGSFGDPMPAGRLNAPSNRAPAAAAVPLLDTTGIHAQPGYGRPRQPDDLSLNLDTFSPEFCGPFVVGPPQLQTIKDQLCFPSGRDRPAAADSHHLLMQQFTETAAVGHKLANHAKQQLQQQQPQQLASGHTSVQVHHPSALQQQQQLARMMHLGIQDQYANSVRSGVTTLNKTVLPSPVPPHLTIQPPPPPIPPPSVTAHPTPGTVPLLVSQSLLQQPPQSPRRAPSPVMFGSQPPMNLTAPLPVHLGPMTPVLSPTLSPNTLQVTQSGSSLSSPVMRVPSPQELSGLAQSILQNALIKKQLEEQKERYIRRQQERNKSPKPQPPSTAAAVPMTTVSGPTKSVAMTSATTSAGNLFETSRAVPSSFLPTSVLRKMANSKVDEKIAIRWNEGEKSVPLLKIVKPDDEGSTEDDSKGAPGKTSINSRNLECHQNSAKYSTGERSSEVLIKSGDDGAAAVTIPSSLSRNLDVASSGAAQHLSLGSASAAAGGDAVEKSSLPTRRLLVGQGLMNLGSAVANPSINQQVAANASLVQLNTAALPTGGFVSTGRQIKGKKLPEPLAVGSVVAPNGGKTKSPNSPMLQQQPYLMTGNNSGGNRATTLAAFNLHALELAKLMEQQRVGVLSPMPIAPIPPSHPPPPTAPQVAPSFIPPVPDNGPFGVKQMPRMLVQPTFGVNSSAANALLLQRLGYPNLQRAGLSSVNQLNQLALIQAIQLQAQQQQQQLQQQQQQQLWNRSAGRGLNCNNNRGLYPAVVPLPRNNASATSATSKTTDVNRSGDLPSNIGHTGLKTDRTETGWKTAGEGSLTVASPGTEGNKQETNVLLSEEVLATDGVGNQLDMEQVVGGDSRSQSICQNDLVSDVGNLAKWFGSEVLHQHLPPLVTPLGQKVLMVDEIEGWQQTTVSKSS